MHHGDRRRKQDRLINNSVKVFRLEAGSSHELSRALRVTHVRDLAFPGYRLYLLDEGGNIMQAQLLPGKHPVVAVLARVECLVAQGEAIASVVAEPDVVTTFSKHEGWRRFKSLERPDHMVNVETVDE
jgi:hypothetical protein